MKNKKLRSRKKLLQWIKSKLSSVNVTELLIRSLITTTIIPLGGAFYTYYRQDKNIREVYRIEDEILAHEKSFAACEIKIVTDDSTYTKEKLFSDTTTHQLIGKDTYENGRLRLRKYFRDSLLIARDIFKYTDDAIPIGKTRDYFNGSLLILRDEFTQSGEILSKTFYESGKEQNKQSFDNRDFRSPLPPSSIIFY